MSSLRPEEIVRKSIAAGYGNPPGSTAGGAHRDDTAPREGTQILYEAELGDWVSIGSLSSGLTTAQTPTEDGDKAWLGVVLHSAASGTMGLVKTTGVGIAKIKPGATMAAGDVLGTVKNQKYADKFGSGTPCGRFLAWIDSGTKTLAWVEIGASASQGLQVHHHTDAKNTQVVDITQGTTPASPGNPGGSLTAPLWHIWKVTNIAFSGTIDARLMHALGGGNTHGETPREGWGWAGVIGNNPRMGFGEIGGNEKGGNQGVLGAEFALDSDHSTDAGPGGTPRINVRSWAGFNARDRYGEEYQRNVYPIRFSYCSNQGRPTWVVPAGCDCMIGVTTSDLCDQAIVWWAGTMKSDPTVKPNNATGWQRQWTPQFAMERDCCSIDYEPLVTTRPDCDILTADGRTILESNVKNLAGAYEGLIPWNYHGCGGRIESLHAICALAFQIMMVWRSLLRFSDATSRSISCLNNAIRVHENFFATKANGFGARPSTQNCCATASDAVNQWTPFRANAGPNNNGDCDATRCDHVIL